MRCFLLCLHPGLRVGPCLAASGLKQQHPEHHQDQASHAQPNEVLHRVVLGVGVWGLRTKRSTRSGQAPVTPEYWMSTQVTHPSLKVMSLCIDPHKWESQVFCDKMMVLAAPENHQEVGLCEGLMPLMPVVPRILPHDCCFPGVPYVGRPLVRSDILALWWRHQNQWVGPLPGYLV